MQAHAYSLIELAEFPEHKLRLLRTRNPWGATEWKGEDMRGAVLGPPATAAGQGSRCGPVCTLTCAAPRLLPQAHGATSPPSGTCTRP